MTNKKQPEVTQEQEKRRQLLKTMGAGSSSVLVSKWVAPVVTAVAIPAHAQTSFAQALNAVGP